jgi:hypothetical protein
MIAATRRPAKFTRVDGRDVAGGGGGFLEHD